MALRIEVRQPAALPAVGPDVQTDELLTRAARTALASQDVGDAELSIALLGDAAISDLNDRYLGRAGPTDVIAFALHEAGEPPLGDVYIGGEQAARQSELFGAGLAEELVRLAIHGTLHVLGYDHPEGAGRERSPMWELQERLVRQATTS